MTRTAVLGFGAVLLIGSAAAAQAQEIVLSSDGRTRSVSPSRDITIRIEGVPGSICTGAEPGVLEVKYLVLSDLATPHFLGSEGKPAEDISPKSTGGVWRVPRPAKDAVVLYHVVRAGSGGDNALKKCQADIDADKKKLKELQDAVDESTSELAAQQLVVAAAAEQVAQLRKSAELYKGLATATTQLQAIIAEISVAETALQSAKAVEQVLAATAKNDEKTLNADDAPVESDIEASESALNALAKGSLLKTGIIGVGRFKSVSYDFLARGARSSLQLMPLGSYPVVRFGDRVFVVVANVKTAAHPRAFFLNATAQAGVAIDIAPVRPTFGSGEIVGIRAVEGEPAVTNRVYTDVVLPLRDSYAPNQFPEVTITTEEASADDPKKLVTVTLVDKAKFPQFRALYRYNFNSGVIGSDLRDSTFQKVRVVADDPATDKVDESRYDTSPLEGPRPVKPVFALTYYLKPVDIQAPVGSSFWLPNPTIGFAFGNPADNVYLGFSHEVLRNAQVFWGWHFGKTTELIERNKVTEREDATDPKTRQAMHRAFSLGVTFNFTAITKIFK